MTRFIFVIKSAIEDFQRNKVRTLLTSLGILIGVASVVLLIALGLGLKKYIAQQFESLGTNLIYILPGNVISGGSLGGPPVGGAEFDNRDVTNLKRLPGVEIVLPFFVKMVHVEAQGNSNVSELAASTADVFAGLNIEVEFGSPYSKADAEQGRKKVVLGSKLAEKLFGTGADAVGKTVKIEDQAFTVIGVAKPKGGGGFGGPSIDEHLYMPFKATTSFNPNKKIFAIYVKAADGSDLTAVKNEIQDNLLKRYKKDDFSVAKQEEFLNAINSIFGIINSVLVAIAAISLVVGGVGIMNIMYVSVVERIHEIGIRRAIGATRADILSQFLAEAVILSLIGGILGLLISFLGVLAVQSVFPAYINLTSILIAVGVSSAIGITFGFFPARKAANLSPIEAIRYE